MPENNFFYYTDRHYEFLYYLLSFAKEQYQSEDPMLADCAKELIRYILKSDETEPVVVTKLITEDEHAVIVNNNKYITFKDIVRTPNTKESENKDCYLVCFGPDARFATYDGFYLSMKKLKEICGKYPSENLIFLQFIQYLDEIEHGIRITLQTPLERWDETDYKHFCLHLVEDSIVKINSKINRWIEVGGERYGSWENPQFTHIIQWYYLSDDELKSMGVRKHIKWIYLYTHLNTINIWFMPFSTKDKRYVKKLQTFVNNICSMPITYDLSNYKEKIQFAESVMDRLATEFRL